MTFIEDDEEDEIVKPREDEACAAVDVRVRVEENEAEEIEINEEDIS